MYDASAVIWKLTRGQMEVYGIVPDGHFAEAAYQELAEFYMNQCGLTKEGLNFYYYEKAGRRLRWDYGWDPCFNNPDQWLRQPLGRSKLEMRQTFGEGPQRTSCRTRRASRRSSIDYGGPVAGN